MRRCHDLTGIAGYVVVCIRARPGVDGFGAAGARTDLTVMEGAGQYPGARERVRCLNAGHASVGAEFGMDIVYTDGCRMPW